LEIPSKKLDEYEESSSSSEEEEEKDKLDFQNVTRLSSRGIESLMDTFHKMQEQS